MAIAVLFTPRSMNASQYDKIIQKTEAAGAPAGRLSHVCFGARSNLRVLDVWEPEESFGAFGQRLMPILQGIAIDPGQPEISEVHNRITG